MHVQQYSYSDICIINNKRAFAMKPWMQVETDLTGAPYGVEAWLATSHITLMRASQVSHIQYSRTTKVPNAELGTLSQAAPAARNVQDRARNCLDARAPSRAMRPHAGLQCCRVACKTNPK